VGYGDPLTSGGSHGDFLTVDVRTGTVTGGADGASSYIPTSAATFVGGDTWYAYGAAFPLAGGGITGIRGELADGQTIATFTDVGGSGTPSGPPVVADGIAYAVRPGGAFIDAIDATGGGDCTNYLPPFCDPLWSAPITGGAALAASGPSLYTSNATGVAAYATGPGVSGPGRQPSWTAAVPGASAVALTPAADATTLLVGADDGTLRAYAADGCGAPTCAPAWTATLGGDLGAPVVGNGVAYVTSSDGHVYALPAAGCGAATCTPLWSATTPGTPQSAILARGHLVVRTTAGTLVAYALPAA
jgi:outer membrane protein assembly factor BamB